MTDPVILGGVVVLVIGAIGGQIVNVIVAWKTSTTVKTIEGHVNSAAQAAAAKLDAAEKTIAALNVNVTELKQAAALLAQSAAVKKDA
jgi:hypothetical protein